ncbi:MAG: hypothetical protein ACKO2G_11635 [Verrucomicrobiales bacterium]
MTTGGLIILILSVGFVTILFVFCLIKVLTTSKKDTLHPYEGEVPDPRRDD